MDVLTAVGSVVAGALTWPPFEYLLHRHQHVFHGREHLLHHARPDTFIPWWKKLVFFCILLAVFGFVSGFYALGVGCAYLAYEWLHHQAHVSPPRTRYGAILRERHFRHHFVDTKMNYGVTNSLFDRILRTDLSQNSVPVPRKLTNGLPWVIDDAGEVRPAYRDRYHLVH